MLTYRQLLEAYLPVGKKSTKDKLVEFMNKEMDAEVLNKIEWSGILDDIKIKLINVSPAQILQDLLEEKWKLKEHDKDMIVMQHQFEYSSPGKEGKSKKIISSLVVKGEDQTYTAMAKTVGLPLAITAKLILQGKIKARGVVIPTTKEIYEPVLSELETFGIKFEEKEIML
jgi:saccharopine dehydrogenase-like NADP-dependent oxidoreductase